MRIWEKIWKNKQRNLFAALALGIFMVFGLGAAFFFSQPQFNHDDQISSEQMEKADFASKGRSRYGSHHCKQHDPRKNCFTETFVQPVDNTQAVDVLFVIQTSSSLEPERSLIVSEIQSFISALPAGADFNIAVMLAHGSTSTYSGILFQADSEPVVLKSTELSNADIQAALALKLTSPPQDPDSGGGEEGLFSLFRAITTPTLLATSQVQGFFRPQAALAVVFVADQRDICATVPAGVPPETNPVKIDARIRDCEGLTPAGLTNRLKLLKGTKPLAVSAIIYADAPVAPDAENEIGYGYTDMVNLNTGVAIDIANDDISQGLASIAALSGQQMMPQQSFTLAHSGADTATIKVTVNGQNVPFQVSGDVVIVTQSIPAGATVIITYCLKSTVHNHCKNDHQRRFGHRCERDDEDDHHHPRPNHHHHDHGKKHPDRDHHDKDKHDRDDHGKKKNKCDDDKKKGKKNVKQKSKGRH